MCFEYFGVFGRKNTLRYGLICGGFPVVGVSGYLIFLIIFNMCQPAGWIFEKNIKNIKDIEDMDLFGVYIGIPDRYFRQYLQTIGIIF